MGKGLFTICTPDAKIADYYSFENEIPYLIGERDTIRGVPIRDS